MKIRRLPAWLIGGTCGLIYFIFILGIDLVNAERAGGALQYFGLITLWFHPYSIWLNRVLNIPFTIVLLIVIDVLVGAVFFELIGRFWKWQDRR